MTVEVQSSISGPFTPNGVTTDFDFDFKVASTTEVSVFDDAGDALSPALYAVTLSSDSEGGTVSFAVAPVASDYAALYIAGAASFAQGSAFTSANFNPTVLNAALDRAAIRDLELRRDIGRALLAPIGEILPPLPAADARSNKFLAYDANGNPIMSSGTGADAGLRTDLAATTGATLTKAADGTTVQANLDKRLPSFATVSTASAASIPTAHDSIQLVGHTNILDSGGATYRRVDDEPAHPGKFQTADGAWWEIAEARVGPHHFGALAAADATTSWQAAIDYASLAGKPIYPIDGLYTLSGTPQGTRKALLVVPVNGGPISIKGSGAGCVLTIPDGFITASDYAFLSVAENAGITNDVEISGICFDGNGANNLVLDSSTHIRGAYVIRLYGGDNIKIHDCVFANHPGRNIINLSGAATDARAFSNVHVYRNLFRNAGGAIEGNENQNDHSSVYAVADGLLVEDNCFTNDYADFTPFSSPTRAVNAVEAHGTNGIVRNNIINNYAGTLVVAYAGDYENFLFEGNKMLNMKGNAFVFFGYAGYYLRRIKLLNNVIHVDNSIDHGGTAIYQNVDATSAATQIEDLELIGNDIFGTLTTPQAYTAHGIQLSAVKRGRIERNSFKNIQGNGILLNNGAAALPIEDVVIDNNSFHNCGIQSSLSRINAINILNADTATVFRRLVVGEKNRISCDAPAVGASAQSCRGIRVQGPGIIQDVRISVPETRNILRTQRIELITQTNSKDVQVFPRKRQIASATTPSSGYFGIGQEVIEHGDWAAGGNMGRVTVTGGCAYEAAWAATTAYVPGQWVQFSSNKYGYCLVGGTSGSSAPAPTTLGTTITDGTVTWFYADTAAAAFKTYGAIAS